MANISAVEISVEDISRLLALIGQPARIQILFVIGEQEACVCHLEAALGMRQASISQHLMALRQASLVATSREGRNIFYRLAQPGVLALLQQAALLAGIQPESLHQLARRPLAGCPCPHCSPGMDPQLTCQKTRPGAKLISGSKEN